MILPKYRFYLGKSIKLKTETDATGTVYTESIPVSPGQLYIDYAASSDETVTLIMSTDTGRPISTNITHAQLFTITESVTAISLSFVGNTNEADERHKALLRDGFSKLYSVVSVNPCYKKLNKKYAKESGQQFFRKSLEGTIKLLGKDFEQVYKASIDQNMLFFVEKLNATTGEWYEYYKGQFSKTDCKFDFHKKVCEPKLSALDQYSSIINNYDNTYDLIKLAPAISKIDMYKRPLIQIYVMGESAISNYFGGTYWESDVNEVIDDRDTLIKKYFFSYLKAGNEFSVEGASIKDANGVYAGTNGVWKGQKGYTCYASSIPSETRASNINFLELRRNSDGAVVYRSTEVYHSTEPDNIWLGRDDVVMQNVNNPSDTCTVKNPVVYHIFMRLLCDVDSVSGEETHELPTDDFVSDNRNYKKCIGLSDGHFYCSTETSTKPTKYGVNDYGQYFTNESIYKTTGLRPLPICRNSWANASLWYVYNDTTYKAWEASLRKKFTLNDSYSIGAVIKALLTKVDPLIVHEETEEYSKFLYSDEPLAPLKWDVFKVYITQKTNILKGEYDQAAQKAEITLKDVMEMLRDCFRCYWYIENNKLKIEHISFFMNGGSYKATPKVQLDFTKQIDAFNKMRASYFQSEIEYDKSELTKRYEFNWMDDVTELFGPVNIDVLANYVQQDKTDEITADNFASDIDFMLFNPSNFSDDGFALLCPVKKGTSLELPIITTNLVDENGRSYELTAQNWYASWPYLVDFYKYDMPAYNVDVDVWAEPYNVNRIKRCMTHSIELHTAEDPDELQLITTQLGNGHIEEASVNLDTRLAEIKLSYEPE